MKSLSWHLKNSRILGARMICGLIWSVRNSYRYGSLVLIYRQADGSYINRRHNSVFVSPEVHAASLDEVSCAALDHWLPNGTIAQGETVLDVGAGIGDEVIVFSRAVGSTGSVVAVEAHPRTFACLQQSIKLNGLTNCRATNVAVSDWAGKIQMVNGSSYLTGKMVCIGTGDVMVDAMTIPKLLDSLAIDSVDFMKMNIEGAELAALRGCIGSFHRIRKMAVSCHDFIADEDPAETAMRTFEAVVELLTSNGYRVTTRRDDPRPWVRYFVYAEQ